MNAFRRGLVGLLFVWLTLQGIAAVAMPFCRGSSDAGQAAAALSTDHQGHHAHGAAAGHDQHEHDLPASAMHSCADCGVCHLACAPVVPTTITLLSPAPPSAAPHSSERSDGLFIPDQPQPPPNALV